MLTKNSMNSQTYDKDFLQINYEKKIALLISLDL